MAPVNRAMEGTPFKVFRTPLTPTLSAPWRFGTAAGANGRTEYRIGLALDETCAREARGYVAPAAVRILATQIALHMAARCWLANAGTASAVGTAKVAAASTASTADRPIHLTTGRDVCAGSRRGAECDGANTRAALVLVTTTSAQAQARRFRASTAISLHITSARLWNT
jgi:hypothetical protein